MSVYPRVCGGTRRIPVPPVVGYGLSPRVRGNPRQSWIGCKLGRSIPACAGEPYAGKRPSVSQRVYPRVCGGTRYAGKAKRIATGLSPRVRGNRHSEFLSFNQCRSIPACAGEPIWWKWPSPFLAVYPRVCGGTVVKLFEIRFRFGLSPRVRGNRIRRPSGLATSRSIPACAGEPRL